jgi:hypothetical protein
MTGGQILATAVALYLVVAAGVLGALTERELLLNPDGERGWRWVGSLALCVVFWPVVGLLWPSSRPVSPQPPFGRYIPPEEDLLPRDAAEGTRTRYIPPLSEELRLSLEKRKIEWVDTARTLSVIDATSPEGTTVYVVDLEAALVRSGRYWRILDCRCQYNSSGYPVVLCRQHRSDVDPQGEPDDNEEEVGR